MTKNCEECEGAFTPSSKHFKRARFCNKVCAGKFNARLVPRTRKNPSDRFWLKVDKTETCWLWRGHLNAGGYGTFQIEVGKSYKAHRWSYEELNGPIPDGLVLDHLCRVRNCVRPSHLEVVTQRENVRRGERAQKTRCKYGHPYDESNTWVSNIGGRQCKSCHRDRERVRYAKRQKESSNGR